MEMDLDMCNRCGVLLVISNEFVSYLSYHACDCHKVTKGINVYGIGVSSIKKKKKIIRRRKAPDSSQSQPKPNPSQPLIHHIPSPSSPSSSKNLKTQSSNHPLAPTTRAKNALATRCSFRLRASATLSSGVLACSRRRRR